MSGLCLGLLNVSAVLFSGDWARGDLREAAAMSSMADDDIPPETPEIVTSLEVFYRLYFS